MLPRLSFIVDKPNEFARLGLGFVAFVYSLQPELRLYYALDRSRWFAPQETFLARPPFEKARPGTAAEKRERVFKEGTEAISEYELAAINIRKNMARLRELRLAKEAADRAIESTAAKPTSKKPTKGTKTR